jgi:polysaccharide deacetylase family protein (PEP-CTERM system associated)
VGIPPSNCEQRRTDLDTSAVSTRSSPRHLASIDLEDWYNDVERSAAVTQEDAARAFDRQLEAIVAILTAERTRCTFFVLGTTAKRFPHWVARLHREGHEIASHGFGHELVTNLTPTLLADNLKRSIDVLGDITDQSPIGYRAPYFSVDREHFWFYDVLIALGFRYSSSVFPFRGWKYGIADHCISAERVCRESGNIVEFPLAVAELGGVRIPVAGGGFWRLLPAPMIEWCVDEAERRGRRFTMYLHPHEFDTVRLRSHRGWSRNLYVNLGRTSVPEKFRRVLSRYDFGTFRELLEA